MTHTTKILVVHTPTLGSTQKMAEAVVDGARSLCGCTGETIFDVDLY
ncbi:hypothetical protein JOY44_27275 (plasmid) [Phormidium sp. CLA17]|nr:hypothetical protein [Leptolyngbya sp. Cla-17]MBM0745180.1 hypothetical protein [Leptolyngbya sp. Cla-17]